MTTSTFSPTDLALEDPVVSSPMTRTRTSRLAGLASSGWLRGGDGDPVWVRPSLIVTMLSTAVLYLWSLGASGAANSYYAAAVQAGSKSWKAMFFGSFDSSNFITVDKTPASLWVMDLSARIFGYSSWSMLVPQALEGVATAGLLYLCVRRVASPAAALIAAGVMALTPVATLMFRFNNPDSLLVLFLVASVYATLRALEAGSTKWLAWAGAFIGFGFLTKMLQALILVPVLAGVYLLCAPNPVRTRIKQLLVAGAAMTAAAGWWIAIVQLWPASSRPYIGGSQHNSILELTLGYNGLGRLTGNETGSVTGGGGGAGGGNMWGATGITRVFGTDMGTQVSWLIPTALVMLVAGLYLTRSLVRTDVRRASLVLWGGWLILTGLVFSFAKGIIHPYYTVALAPAIGALIGTMVVALWQQRDHGLPRYVMAAAMSLNTIWCYILLKRSPTWHPQLRNAVLLGGIAATALILAWPLLKGRAPKYASAAVAALAMLAGIAAPAAASLNTAATPHTGSIPSAGPVTIGARSGPGGGAGRGLRQQFGAPPQFGAGTGQQFAPPQFGGGAGTAPGGQGGPGSVGGLLDASAPSAELIAALKTNVSQYTWVAAGVGANSIGGVEIATGLPVMAIGGFNGSDPTPTLAAFQQLVTQGKIHYFLGGGQGFGQANGGSNVGSLISAWVQANFTASTIGSTTVYDLTSGVANSAT